MPLLIGFTGQGMQHNKMFSVLKADNFGKHWLKEASDFLHIDLLDESVVEKACTDVVLVQCLIALLSTGAFYALKQQMNLDSVLLCGYSLGEISAFSVSVNLDLPEICALIESRACCMQQSASEFTHHQQSGLAALKGKVNFQQMLHLIHSHQCYLAIINAEDHFIIGGLIADIDSLLIEAKGQGIIKAERLPIHLPSHTPMLAKATDNFSLELQRLSSREMKYPILNALTLEIVDNTQGILPILSKELSQTLHWNKVMSIAAEYGISTFLELGPGSALKNMALASFQHLRAYNLESFSSMSGIVKFLSS